jgi:hypothetical protein
MASLYELTGDYAKFAEIAQQGDLDDDMQAMLDDALANLADDIEVKLENYAKVIKNFESDIEGLKKEEDRLAGKRKTLENRVKSMKTAMRDAMIATGKLKVKGDLFSFTVRNNAPSVVMDEQYIENIPEKYLIAQEPKIDRKLLAEDIKSGADLEGIAHLESSQSILIK